jgi:hypothetical protein
MSHNHLKREEIARRGEEIYAQNLRDKLETPDNIGKIIVINVETGDYEIDSDGLEANHRALARHPGAPLYGLRIGYDAVEGFGSGPQRLKQ